MVSVTGMEVRFERTARRRYAVAVLRTRHGNLRLDPAPGYSDLIPHDLVHFVVEDEFGLRQGIFGQIAAARQVERRNRSTGGDMGRSEDLAAQVYPRWLRHSGHLPSSHYVHQDPPATDLAATDLDQAFKRLDALSKQWGAVEVGGAMTVVWPWPERA